MQKLPAFRQTRKSLLSLWGNLEKVKSNRGVLLSNFEGLKGLKLLYLVLSMSPKSAISTPTIVIITTTATPPGVIEIVFKLV